MRVLGEPQTEARHQCVQGDRHQRRHDHVGHTQEVEAREQGADDGTGDVATVEKAHPRHTLGGRFHVPGDGRQGGAHHQGGRQEDDGGDQTAQEHAELTGAGDGRVDAAQQRHDQEHQQSAETNAQFEVGIHLERVMFFVNLLREHPAAQAHAAHEHTQQDTHGDGRRPQRQLEHLEPDDLVDQRGGAAPHKQGQHGWQGTIDSSGGRSAGVFHSPGILSKASARLLRRSPGSRSPRGRIGWAR